MDNEFLLMDRIDKIRAINKEYDLENNAYISFSGGKDSTVLHYLLDLALPNNKIPRVYINTGIEYTKMVQFVKEMQQKDDRILIVNSGVNIRKMLRENGYPFKSKGYSKYWSVYNNNNADKVDEIVNYLNEHPEKQKDYDYIHNLPYGVKTSIKFIFGLRERER